MFRSMMIGPICLIATLSGETRNLTEARALYESTKFRASLQVLHGISGPDGAVDYLKGRNYYMLGDFGEAQRALSKAIAAEPGNSNYHLWLGRAFGRRAERTRRHTCGRESGDSPRRVRSVLHEPGCLGSRFHASRSELRYISWIGTRPRRPRALVL